MSCGAVEALAEAIPKAYDDPKLLEEYCRSLKYLMHKGKAPLPPYNFCNYELYVYYTMLYSFARTRIVALNSEFENNNRSFLELLWIAHTLVI